MWHFASAKRCDVNAGRQRDIQPVYAIRRRLDDGKPLCRDDVLVRAQRVLVHRALRLWLGVRDQRGHVVHCHRRTWRISTCKVYGLVIDLVSIYKPSINSPLLIINWPVRKIRDFNFVKPWRSTSLRCLVATLHFSLNHLYFHSPHEFNVTLLLLTLHLECVTWKDLNFFFRRSCDKRLYVLYIIEKKLDRRK